MDHVVKGGETFLRVGEGFLLPAQFAEDRTSQEVATEVLVLDHFRCGLKLPLCLFESHVGLDRGSAQLVGLAHREVHLGGEVVVTALERPQGLDAGIQGRFPVVEPELLLGPGQPASRQERPFGAFLGNEFQETLPQCFRRGLLKVRVIFEAEDGHAENREFRFVVNRLDLT